MTMVPCVVPHDVPDEVVNGESGMWNSKHDYVGGNNLCSRSEDLAVHEQLDQLRDSHDGPDACNGDASDQRNVLEPFVLAVVDWRPQDVEPGDDVHEGGPGGVRDEADVAASPKLEREYHEDVVT